MNDLKRMFELLKIAVEHIEAFEEDQSEEVLQALGFTEDDLAAIRFKPELDKQDIRNIQMVEGRLFHHGEVIWQLSYAGKQYIFSDQQEEGDHWRAENVPFKKYSHYFFIDEQKPEPVYIGYAWYGPTDNYIQEFKTLDECLDWLVPEREKPGLDVQIHSATERGRINEMKATGSSKVMEYSQDR